MCITLYYITCYITTDLIRKALSTRNLSSSQQQIQVFQNSVIFTCKLTLSVATKTSKAFSLKQQA